MTNEPQSSTTVENTIVEDPSIFDFPKEGDLPFKMTNDYLFKMLLQKSEKALRGLICALLHLEPNEIESTEITNAILNGESITDKTFMLDVKVLLNNNQSLDIEMQVINENNWQERSLAYLCRDYDQIARGNEYNYGDMMPVHQIGILNFTLFKDSPEFYSTYLMKNAKSDHVYSDKFKLSVLDLTQIDNATEEDKLYGIDYWARFFSAKKWEDLYMLAKKNDTMAEATHTIHYLTGDDLVREQMIRREEYLKHQEYTQKKLAEYEAQNSELKDALALKDTALAEVTDELAEQRALVEELKRQLAEAYKEK